MRITILLSVLLFFNTCSNPYGDENALATYEDQALYFSDIASSFPKKLNEKDSLVLLNKIVSSWIVRQLVYDKALQHGTYDDLRIEQQVLSYKQEIVIHEYKSKLLVEKIDTLVTSEQIQQYYDQHSNEFPLRENILKYYYVKIPKSVPEGYRLSGWLQNAGSEEQLVEIKEFSYQNARLYEFDENWVRFEKIRPLLPDEIEDEGEFLRRTTVHQQRDDLYLYFLKITDYKQKGEIAPLEYLINDIKQIIISKRKMDFLNKFENSLINEAKNSSKVKINI